MNISKINRRSVFFILAILTIVYVSNRFQDRLLGKKTINSGRYAVISIDLDTNLDFYLFYLPITAMSWRLIDFEPLIIAVVLDQTDSNILAKKTLEYLEILKVKVIFLKSLPKYSKITGMLTRLFVGIIDDLSDNDFIFQSDADLLPINKTYYNNFDKTDDIKLFDVSSFQSPIGKFGWRGRDYQMYFMGHIGMTKKQWRHIMHFNENSSKYKFNGESIISLVREYFDDSRLKANHDIHRGDETWYLDQHIISINIQKHLDDPKNKMYRNPSPGIKLDRIWSDEKWLSTLANKYKDINDVHLFHENYLEKMNFLDLLLIKMFSKQDKAFIDKYIKEFMEIKLKKKIR